MKIENKIIRLEKEQILEMEEIILDGDRDRAYEFAQKLKVDIEKQEENYLFHRKLSGI